MSDEKRASGSGADFGRIVALLGGRRVLGRHPSNALDAHELLLSGLPGEALTHLLSSLRVLRGAAPLERAIGMSTRTFQRRKNTPERHLNQDQSGRTWKFAEVLARVTALLGSQEDAERWLAEPAIGLNRRRPIELLSTPAGVELLENYLTRLEYGVYT